MPYLIRPRRLATASISASVARFAQRGIFDALRHSANAAVNASTWLLSRVLDRAYSRNGAGSVMLPRFRPGADPPFSFVIR